MTSDYQSGASAMRETCARYIRYFYPHLADGIMALPLPADPASGEGAAMVVAGASKQFMEARDATIKARDAEIAALRAALEKANYALSCLPECGLVIHRSEANEVSEAIEVIKQATKPHEEDEPRFVPAGPEGMP